MELDKTSWTHNNYLNDKIVSRLNIKSLEFHTVAYIWKS